VGPLIKVLDLGGGDRLGVHWVPSPPPAQEPPVSLSCFCFSQAQVETSPVLSSAPPSWCS
jgi:hypothetical protein